jgi:N-acetylglucosamine-6-phosphate deacetylase
MLSAIDAGASHVTHLFNASAGLHHRQPGLVGTALTDDRLSVELIADGVHLASARDRHRPALQAAGEGRAGQRRRRCGGMPPGEIELFGVRCVARDAVRAGHGTVGGKPAHARPCRA